MGPERRGEPRKMAMELDPNAGSKAGGYCPTGSGLRAVQCGVVGTSENE